MPAERCLILAAGFGKRMGQIGNVLPKVLWPVFRLPLLELQLLFARSLGRDEVWINLHHQGDQIRRWAEGRAAFSGVRWLEEKPGILDVGGAIHNLARQPEVGYSGELLVMNADQFLWFTRSDLDAWRAAAPGWEVLLLNWSVNSSQGYNQVLSDNMRRFLRVVPNQEIARDFPMETYSGNSLVRLDSLRPHEGASSFFESVCVADERHCHTAMLKAGRYWDFGTAARYWNSMRGIMEAKVAGDEDPFIRFLRSTGAFVDEEFNAATLSYGCDVPNLVHLGNGIPAAGHSPGVVLSGGPVGPGGPALVHNGVVQPL